MFGWFRKRSPSPAPEGKIAHQTPGALFAWAKGWRLTALDEAVLTIPAAVLANDEPIGSVIHADDGVRLQLPAEPPSPDIRILIWLQPGESVWLTKSCQAFVMPARQGDTAARRFRVEEVP